VWFIGFTPNLVAGVWVGFDVKKSLGPAETGGRMALPLWIAFMQRVLPDLPAEDFPVPDNVVAVRVNHDTGFPVSPEEQGAIQEYFIKGTEPAPFEATAPPSLSPTPAQASPPPSALSPGVATPAPQGEPPASLALPRPADR
jgi:penicillin-binding protein 1A